MNLPEKITHYRGKKIDDLNKSELLNIIHLLYKRWKNTYERNIELRTERFNSFIDELINKNKI